MLLLFVNSCKKELYVKEEIDPAQRAKISEYLKSPKIQTISFNGFSKNVNMASLGNLKEVMLNSENVSKGKLMAVGQNASTKPRYKVNIDAYSRYYIKMGYYGYPIDKIESVAQPQPTLAQQHHEFMAMNIEIIKNGLKSFSLANNSNHSNFNADRFEALAYQRLELTSYLPQYRL
ncbi:hypothetical protein [Pedobacter namyangjuensis]|uniref:hypothetical protein n=1 Tax=Pedobacter namyangjuensis TaxID=600626 RepID=UPI000DE348A5|nr:hypothetical protein [Pedobacter namyangjuensis]